MDEGREQFMCEGIDVSVLKGTGGECRLVDASLDEKAARLQAILDTTVDGIITIDERATIQSFNKAAERIFGYSAGEVIGRNVNALQPSPYREHHDQYIRNYLETGTRKIIGIGREVTGRRKDGSTFPLYLAVSEVWVGEERFFTGVLRDLTEQKEALEAIRASEEKHRALVQSSSDAILMMDGERNIISFNQAFLDLFGFSGEEVERHSVRIIHPSDESYIAFGEMAFPAIELAGSFRGEWELARKDGSIIPIEETLSAVKAPDGAILGFVAVIRDITERRQAEKKLEEYRDRLEAMVVERTRELQEAYKAMLQEEKLKTLGTISAEMAHEIRNPLMSIGGFARRLQKKFPEIAEIGIIVEESARLERILKRIENYLKPVEMRPRVCSVIRIIEDAVALISAELERQGIALHLALTRELPPVYVDPAVLIQVIVNVIHNALKVMRQDGRITVETFESDQNVHISVRAPIREKLKNPEHVFMPFGEEREEISVPVCFQLLRSMGGNLFLTQEGDAVVFAASLLKTLGNAEECD